MDCQPWFFCACNLPKLAEGKGLSNKEVIDKLKINKRIADLAGLKVDTTKNKVFMEQLALQYNLGYGVEFDVFSDHLGFKALALDMVEKYGIKRKYEPCHCLGWYWQIDHRDNEKCFAAFEFDDTRDPEQVSPTVAIFLAVIEKEGY